MSLIKSFKKVIDLLYGGTPALGYAPAVTIVDADGASTSAGGGGQSSPVVPVDIGGTGTVDFSAKNSNYVCLRGTFTDISIELEWLGVSPQSDVLAKAFVVTPDTMLTRVIPLGGGSSISQPDILFVPTYGCDNVKITATGTTGYAYGTTEPIVPLNQIPAPFNFESWSSFTFNSISRHRYMKLNVTAGQVTMNYTGGVGSRVVLAGQAFESADVGRNYENCSFTGDGAAVYTVDWIPAVI